MMRRSVGVVLAALAVLVAITPGNADALVEQPFGARFSTNDQGAVWVTGNTLMTCGPAAPNCAASQGGTASGAALNNNGFVMQRVDVDADATTFASSTSTFAPPASSEVLFAALYFGGRVTAGTSGAAAPNAGARGTALLRTPTSGAYVPVTGAVADSTAVAGSFTAVADVTALVQAGGAGQYTVANVQSGTGTDRYAGWSLVIVYRDLALPLRNLTVFDGLAAIQQGDPPLSIAVSGFTTPLSGPVRTSVGVVAYEGDRGSAGDRLSLAGLPLTDAANPANNVFNSSIAFEGTDSVATRVPGYVNQLGFDADRILADGFLANGATGATFEASTTLDQYLIQAVTFTTDLSTPRLVVGKTVTDLNGGDVQPGDVLRYAVTTTNTGDDAANGVRVSDAVPAGTALAPGSLTGPGASVTGATAAFDVGALAAGASATTGFDVVVNADAADGFVVRNTASATGVGATAGREVSAVSPEVTSVVRRPPPPAFDVDTTVTPKAPAADQPAVVGVTVTNELDRPVENVVVTVEVPGAAILSATAEGGTCTVGEVVTCTFASLAAGAQAKVRVRVRPRKAGTLRPIVTVTGDGVPSVRVTAEGVRVAGKARLSVHKRAAVSAARAGQTVAYRLTVKAASGGVAAKRVLLCDRPGTGLRLVSASHGGVLRKGLACWRFATIKAGRSVTVKAVARIGASGGVVRNAALVRAANVRGGAPRASVARVRVEPGRAGACSAATRPLGNAAC